MPDPLSPSFKKFIQRLRVIAMGTYLNGINAMPVEEAVKFSLVAFRSQGQSSPVSFVRKINSGFPTGFQVF